LFSFGFNIELNSTQFVIAQPFHASPERRDRQIIMVDDQPGRKTREICPSTSYLHGNIKVREETWTSQEEGN